MGGAYTVAQVETGTAEDRQAWNIAVSYQNDDVGTEIDTDRYTVGVTYKAGPGISFRGSVEYLEADVTGGNDFDGTAVLVGTSIDF